MSDDTDHEITTPRSAPHRDKPQSRKWLVDMAKVVIPVLLSSIGAYKTATSEAEKDTATSYETLAPKVNEQQRAIERLEKQNLALWQSLAMRGGVPLAGIDLGQLGIIGSGAGAGSGSGYGSSGGGIAAGSDGDGIPAATTKRPARPRPTAARPEPPPAMNHVEKVELTPPSDLFKQMPRQEPLPERWNAAKP